MALFVRVTFCLIAVGAVDVSGLWSGSRRAGSTGWLLTPGLISSSTYRKVAEDKINSSLLPPSFQSTVHMLVNLNASQTMSYRYYFDYPNQRMAMRDMAAGVDPVTSQIALCGINATYTFNSTYCEKAILPCSVSRQWLPGFSLAMKFMLGPRHRGIPIEMWTIRQPGLSVEVLVQEDGAPVHFIAVDSPKNDVGEGYYSDTRTPAHSRAFDLPTYCPTTSGRRLEDRLLFRTVKGKRPVV